MNIFPLILWAATLQGSGYDEEIVVTADFRGTPVDSLAASVSVVRPEARGDLVNHLEEVLGQIPNVNYASGASRGRFFQIRGIGERGQFSEPANSSTGLIIDGVDMSGIGGAATLFDVEQVEVLRGPQGTLYGANALAGLINITTPAPTSRHHAKLFLDAGEYGALGVGAVVSGPVSENVGYRLSVRQYRDDGFTENEHFGRDNTNNHDELTVRGKLRWLTGDRQWQLNFGRMDIENGYDAFSLDNNRTTLSDQPGRDEQLTDYAALKMSQDFERVRFEASGAVARTDVDYGYDEDWAYTGFDPIGYTSFDLYQRERETRTLEARWLSQPEHSVVGWDWVVGIYALRQDVDLERTYTFAGPFESDHQSERVALYAELARELGQRWQLTIGGRFERHGAEYDDTAGVGFDPQENLFGGRILLERPIDDGGMFYAGISQGYKTGGFNQDGSLPANLRSYDEETLWNVELGYKARWIEGKLRIRAAIFRMQREDIQLQTSEIIPVPGSPVGDFVVFRNNATKGFNQGVEIETEFAVTEQLMFFANIGYLDSEYDKFVNASGNLVKGREQAHAPTYQFFAGAELYFSELLTARLEIEGKDGFYFSDSHDVKSDSFELLNASVTYQGEGWQAKLWGRNLTDEDYEVRGFLFGNDPRDFYTTRPFTQLGEPSRVGISVSFELD